MQIAAIFLEKGYELNHSYRGLIVAILNAGDKFTRQSEYILGVTAEQFRLEAAEVISNLCQKWGDWHPYTSENEPWRNWSNWYPYIDNEAKHMLGCLEEIAETLERRAVHHCWSEYGASVRGKNYCNPFIYECRFC